MVRYVVLFDFTQQGISKVSETIARADSFAEAAKKAGATVTSVYWTVGPHDGMLLLEAPDEQTATTLLLKLGSQGNVRSHTLRAFDRKEMDGMLKKI